MATRDKKIRDGILDHKNNQDNVVTEELSCPDSVQILYCCNKNLEKKVQGIHIKTEKTKMSEIKGKQHLMDLKKTVDFICEKFDEFECEKAKKERVINEPMKNVSDMPATRESLKGSIDRQTRAVLKEEPTANSRKRGYG